MERAISYGSIKKQSSIDPFLDYTKMDIFILEILVSEIPVVVTIATELRTAKDSSTYETLSIEAVGDEQKVYEQGTQMIMTASFMQLGRMFALSNILQGKDTTMTLDSAVVFFDMMDARMNESIYNFVIMVLPILSRII